MKTRFAYLHGFASGPRSRKGVWLRDALARDGVVLGCPDLNVPSFAELSVGAMLERLDQLDASSREGAPPPPPAGVNPAGPPSEEAEAPEPWSFIGSSLGGYLTTLFAARRPGRVARAVLLCPAFDLGGRWPALMPHEQMERWRRDGVLPFADGAGTMVPLSYRFYEEVVRYPPMPEIACPTVIVHGRHDERVPVALSRTYAASRSHVELVEVDDGHDLLDSLDVILEVVRRHLLTT